ncbi:uncharacterized protein [Prorops nasuta]|uniref:uncharacterized protein n=1 Tax=Prorops nasuta TaxID=863751 RepID=UPI0034CF4F0E
MSSISSDDLTSPKIIFRSVNGNIIELTETKNQCSTTDTNGVIKFDLQSETLLYFYGILLLLFTVQCIWYTNTCLFLFTIIALVILLKYKHIFVARNKDTLIVIESVGIYVLTKGPLLSYNSSEFLAWSTVKDVFINEVIIHNQWKG